MKNRFWNSISRIRLFSPSGTNLLNPSQERAVKNHGHQLILAGPGSGKTRVITGKILHLLDQGIDPNQILALTFSEKAAKEMLERLVERTDTHDLTISHSFGNSSFRITHGRNRFLFSDDDLISHA